MSGVPSMPSIPGGSSRAEKAARLMAEMEAKKKQAQAQTEAHVGAAAAQQAGAQFHAVRKGETLQSVARQYGQTAAALWNHPLNKPLRDRVGSPQKLAPGDGLYVPSQQEQQGTGPVGQGDYVVKDGDCISSIARDTGHFWKTIWADPANAELKQTRQDPNVLYPGDRVTIPPRQPKQEAGQTEMRHRFVRRGEPSELHLRILRQDDTPRANEPYELEIDGQVTTGVSDANGSVRLPVPGHARRGVLTVGPAQDQVVYELQLGGLAPISTKDGVRDRLRNLGQRVGSDDASLAAGLRAFQEKHGLPVTGQADGATRAKLTELHGS
jgi:LysM repeat protein